MVLKFASATALSYKHPVWLKDLVIAKDIAPFGALKELNIFSVSLSPKT